MAAKEKVLIAIPSLGTVTMGLASAMSKIREDGLDADSRYHFGFLWLEGARPVDYARNLICQKFLEHGYSRLWFMDSDTVPPPGILSLLDIDADIVSGVTPTWGNVAYNTAPQPNYTIYRYDEGLGGMTHSPCYNDGLEEVDGVGTAMMLIRRRVIADRRLHLPREYKAFDGAAKTLDDSEPPAIFREVRKPTGQLDMSEDVDFCFRARKLGYRVVVDHGMKCGHVKAVDVKKVIDWGLRFAQQKVEMVDDLEQPAPSGSEESSSHREARHNEAVHASGS